MVGEELNHEGSRERIIEDEVQLNAERVPVEDGPDTWRKLFSFLGPAFLVRLANLNLMLYSFSMC